MGPRREVESPFFTSATVRPIVVTVAEAPAENRARAAAYEEDRFLFLRFQAQ